MVRRHQRPARNLLPTVRLGSSAGCAGAPSHAQRNLIADPRDRRLARRLRLGLERICARRRREFRHVGNRVHDRRVNGGYGGNGITRRNGETEKRRQNGVEWPRTGRSRSTGRRRRHARSDEAKNKPHEKHAVACLSAPSLRAWRHASQAAASNGPMQAAGGPSPFASVPSLLRVDPFPPYAPLPHNPKNNQHTTAATTVIDNPQASSLLNRARVSVPGGAAARQSAPSVESGETSTRCPPMIIDETSASGSPPPICSINFGIVGSSAGSTTPMVLLYREITPEKNAAAAVDVSGVASRPRKSANNAIPPVRSSSDTSSVTPHTMTITPQGIACTAAFSLAALASVSTTAPAKAPSPTLMLKTITPVMSIRITAHVSQCRHSSGRSSAIWRPMDSEAAGPAAVSVPLGAPA